ncbi:hypothetical protein SteCoe_28767 [Stentor coeruleus]|uniref:ATP-dependent DNA helicase n=1 Tax=Stentor coeruleus TaxID=5963 RepID=A0A1R2B7F9_9CILI|nr:hypothetical protein SteCoe_28767 [Stentor coeruleus]
MQKLEPEAGKQNTILQKVIEINRTVFKNNIFRPNQQEIILASLSDKDIFVCMPTGGGKSLTFQLPAVINNGLTVVIMPLVSLIQDQVAHLNDLNISNRVIGAFKSKNSSNIFSEILADSSVKIIFLTPEKISKSQKTCDFLNKIYKQGKLNRFAIDEAHCVSQWGREFRSDYLKLSMLRKKFPNVPIITLTGTATEKVRKDVINVLKLKNPQVFLASFNRENLYYEVREKNTSKIVGEITEFIKTNHLKNSGIIYCISKKDCEKLAKDLKKEGIKSSYYHASMTDKKRSSNQVKWMEGKILVLVATIAFGMGIDKKNVRFVIHYAFPKSIENYYQESGRAGRDGHISDCLIFFSYSDKYKHDRLIQKNKQTDRNFQELYTIMKYCENFTTCRRKIQLEYFGEYFDPIKCNKMCDNCRNKNNETQEDCSETAKKILQVLANQPDGINTLAQLTGFLKGIKCKKNEDLTDFPGFGSMIDMKTEDIGKVIRKLIYDDAINEKTVKCSKKFKMTKLELGSKSTEVLLGTMKIYLPVILKNKLNTNDQVYKQNEQNTHVEKTQGNQQISNNSIYMQNNGNNIIMQIGKLRYNPPMQSTNNFQSITYIEKPRLSIDSWSSFKNKPFVPSSFFPKQRPSLEKAPFLSDDYIPRIPVTKDVELILDTPVTVNQKSNDYELNDEQYEELKERLEIVRKKLSRISGKSIEEILSNDKLDKLSRTMQSEDIQKEFTSEILYFQKVNQISIENSSAERFEFHTMRRFNEDSYKRLKFN